MEGRRDAFDEFVEIFRRRVFQYSYLMCGQREDAEEVAQDTLLKIFENLTALRNPESVRSWVFRIARNACLMKRRKSLFAPDHELSLENYLAEHTPGDGPHGQIRDAGPLPDQQVLQHELNTALTNAIRELPPVYRSVILLRDIEELSTEEAADILDVTIDVVKQRLHRGRLALKKALDEQLRPPNMPAENHNAGL